MTQPLVAASPRGIVAVMLIAPMLNRRRSALQPHCGHVQASGAILVRAESAARSGRPPRQNARVNMPATARGSASILRDPLFARLWFIQAATQVGGNMALYALTILVFASTRSNAAVSALVMLRPVPTIVLSAVAGVLVDRLDVRWALIVPNTSGAASDARAGARRRRTSRCCSP